jgi:hypothetical protein
MAEIDLPPKVDGKCRVTLHTGGEQGSTAHQVAHTTLVVPLTCYLLSAHTQT